MKNNFLYDDGIKKMNFNSFDIEKIFSEHLIIVTICPKTEFVSVNINKTERLLQIISKPFVGDFSQQDKNEIESYCFLLPDFIDIEGYSMKNTNNKFCFIFRRINVCSEFLYFY